MNPFNFTNNHLQNVTNINNNNPTNGNNPNSTTHNQSIQYTPQSIPMQGLLPQPDPSMFNPNSIQRNLLPKPLPNMMPLPNLQMPQLAPRPLMTNFNLPKPTQLANFIQPSKPIAVPQPMPVAAVNPNMNAHPQSAQPSPITDQHGVKGLRDASLLNIDEKDIIKIENDDKLQSTLESIKLKDKEYELQLKKQDEMNLKLKSKLHEKFTQNRTKPLLPPPTLLPSMRSRVSSYQRFGLDQPRKLNKKLASLKLGLCPIRLELELNQHKLRDVLLWNVYEPIVTVEAFAELLCQDSLLPPQFAPLVTTSMNEQIEDYAKYGEETLLHLKNLSEQGLILPELVIDIQIDITIGNVNLEDKFSWDILSSHSDPERMAYLTCQDLGLGGEFITCYAHSIREQCFTYLKSLKLIDHDFTSSYIRELDLQRCFLPPPIKNVRPTHDIPNYTPMLTELSPGELDRMEKDREREYRRKRRQTRSRRGITLPEREPQKTAPTRHPPLPLPIPFPDSDPSALSRALSPKSQQKAADRSKNFKKRLQHFD